MPHTLKPEKLCCSISVGQASNPGHVREDNEDSFGWVTTPAGELLVVADGMGGHLGGKTAGKLAVEAISKYISENGESVLDRGQLLREALYKADKLILQTAEEDEHLRGMGSTVVALLIEYKKSWFIHAGDSRIYLFAKDESMQLTKDHSLVQLMEDMGEISHEDALHFERRNVITQSLGGNINSALIMPIEMDCFPGDQFLLCTDGLTEMVSDLEIRKVMETEASPKEKADKLVDMALAAGGHDNVTVQIASILSQPHQIPIASLSEGKPPKRLLGLKAHRITYLLIGLVIGLMLGYFLFNNPDLPKAAPETLQPGPVVIGQSDITENAKAVAEENPQNALDSQRDGAKAKETDGPKEAAIQAEKGESSGDSEASRRQAESGDESIVSSEDSDTKDPSGEEPSFEELEIQRSNVDESILEKGNIEEADIDKANIEESNKEKPDGEKDPERAEDTVES